MNIAGEEQDFSLPLADVPGLSCASSSHPVSDGPTVKMGPREQGLNEGGGAGEDSSDWFTVKMKSKEEGLEQGLNSGRGVLGLSQEDHARVLHGCRVRDVWVGADLGTVTSHVNLTLRPHASAFLVFGAS